MGSGAPVPGSVAEHRALLAAQRGAAAFVVYADADGGQCIVTLDPDVERYSIGRSDAADIALAWDQRVSRTHATLEHVGADWVVADDGLSRNGTFVNEVRVSRSQRLHDGDVIRVGHALLTFKDPSAGASIVTIAGDEPKAATLSPAQQRVITALCRPALQAGGAALPATNEQIAQELCLSVDAVKAHLRQLFRLFELDGLPQVQKRVALMRAAIDSGVARRQP